MGILTNKYIIAFGIPLILIICGGVIKKLVRGAPSWEQDDFFLGIELLFASFTSAIFNILYGLNNPTALPTQTASQQTNPLLMSTVFLAISFFMLLLVMGIHQTWALNSQEKNKRFLWLGVVCNTIGVAVLAIFYLGVKAP